MRNGIVSSTLANKIFDIKGSTLTKRLDFTTTHLDITTLT